MSPIIAALILFLVSVAMLIVVLAMMKLRFEGSESIVEAVSRDVQRVMKSELRIVVCTPVSNGTIVIGLMNVGIDSERVLGIYMDGEPANVTKIDCEGSLRKLPFDINPGELCTLHVVFREEGTHTISISTYFENLVIEVQT